MAFSKITLPPKILCGPSLMSFPTRTAKLKQFATLSESGERSPPMHAFLRDHSSGANFKGLRKGSA
jgi:hypothetical protein